MDLDAIVVGEKSSLFGNSSAQWFADRANSDIGQTLLSCQESKDPPADHLIVISDDSGRKIESLGDALSASGYQVLYAKSGQGLGEVVESIELLANGQKLSSIHMLSHGLQGGFRIGRDLVTGTTLDNHEDELQRLGSLLKDEGDLLIYGCNVGRGENGIQFTKSLSVLTGADVATSNDITGNTSDSNKANWELEVTEGTIESENLILWDNYNLPDITLPLGLGSVIGGALVGWGVGWVMDQVTGASNITIEYPEGQTPPPGQPNPSITTGIQPGVPVKSAYYLDTDGDLVSIVISGPGSFSVDLAGGLTNNADATTVRIFGTDATSGLSISVSPLELEMNAGSIIEGANGLYNRMYSGGYTNIETIGGTIGQGGGLKSVELSGVIASKIDLEDVTIENITLDTGYATYVDRINTSSLYNAMSIESSTNFSGNTIDGGTNNQAEIVDFAGVFDDQAPVTNGGSSYNPVSGLIDLGDIRAKEIGSIVVNGAIGAPSGDPYDRSFSTNDLRGEIEVTGKIGSIEAKRSRLNGNIKAGSIGSIDLGRIDGSITTTDQSQDLTVQLPYDYQGFITSAGHLNLAYTFEALANTAKGGGEAGGEENNTTGEIRSLSGISGIFPEENDAIYVPDQYVGVVINRSTTKGIADININGTGMSRWQSEHNIGNITANAFTESMIVEAKKNILNIETHIRTPVPVAEPPDPPAEAPVEALAGFFQAGESIGNVKSATSVGADLRAVKGSIGDITALTGGIESALIDANIDVGNLWAHNQPEGNSGKIVARTGNIGDVYLGIGTWGATLSAGQDIGNVYIEKGKLLNPTFAAKRDIQSITVKGANTTIEGGTISAGRKIGNVEVIASKGIAMNGVLLQAGDEYGYDSSVSADTLKQSQAKPASIEGIKVIAYGGMTLEAIEAGVKPVGNVNLSDGIINSQFIAGNIGSIDSRAYTGNGIVDTVVHAKVLDVGDITAIGNGDGLRRVNITAQGSLGDITGLSQMQGDGIYLSRFHANDGKIGLVTGRGGVAGGRGIFETYSQSRTRTEGFVGISNANGGHAIELLTAHARSYGNISATVRGGEGGEPNNSISHGILESSLTSYDGGINLISVENNSINGEGVVESIFDISGQIGAIKSVTYNATGINKTEFIAENDIGSIGSKAMHGGSGVLGSIFRSKYGSIGLQPTNQKAGIEVRAEGDSSLDTGIEGSEFTAYGSIGDIDVMSKGGAAISGSTFDADHDTATGGFRNLGNIGNIKVAAGGIYPGSSHGIEGSNFTAANIGTINVDVSEFRGGTGILNSQFAARNAIYNENNGAFDNTAKIGSIKVRNGSRTGNGIEGSDFIAGAAGEIKSIYVDTTWNKVDQTNPFNRGASGKGIYLSSFRASGLDPDQAVMNGKIGTITVRSGRVTPNLIPPDYILPGTTAPNDQFTGAAAGIDLSYFAAYGGIKKVVVDSIGTGVFGSAFLANRDIANGIGGSLLANYADVKPAGSIQSVDVRANGRWSSGVVLSALVGNSIGSVSIQARNGPLVQPVPPQALALKRNNKSTSDVVIANQADQAVQPVLPLVALISEALRSTGLNPVLDIVAPQTLEEYEATNLMRYVAPSQSAVSTGDASATKAIRNALTSDPGQSGNSFSQLLPIDLGYAPVSGSLLVATKGKIGTTTITNLNEGNPFFGSLFYAKRSYGPVSTTSKAKKNSLDPTIEASVRALGYKNVNSFSRNLSAFLGRQSPGGNLPPASIV